MTTNEHDYKTHDPRGWCGDPSRGAALGRPTIEPDDTTDYTGTLALRRAHIDRDGYDINGTYFGIGDPLWWVTDGADVDYVFRAEDRNEARAEVVARYPHATITAGPVDALYVTNMLAAYIEAALWSSLDYPEDDTEEAPPMDATYGPGDVDPEAEATMRKDCEDFLAACAAAGIEMSELDSDQVGHDFWLTRNGHGVGFHDRGNGEPWDTLDRLSDEAGECHIHGASDGKVHVD